MIPNFGSINTALDFDTVATMERLILGGAGEHHVGWIGEIPHEWLLFRILMP